MIARFTDEPRAITRTFLSEAARECHSYLSRWMQSIGMRVETDSAGNLRGIYGGTHSNAGRILIGSHLDTVLNAGAYDGVLGVVMGISLVESLCGERLPFLIEVVGFSEEEGVRFGVPFIGSRALAGTLDEKTLQITDASGISIEQSIRGFGLDPSRLDEARVASNARAYLEFHIEQGPVLESLGLPLALVDAVAGQSRARLTFYGTANHAGTTPMSLRRDALCGAAEWILLVEKFARATQGLVATVGKIEAAPGASNVIPGAVTLTLDVRHAIDPIRTQAFETLLHRGEEIARQRGLAFRSTALLDQNTVPMHPGLADRVEQAFKEAGVVLHRMLSGAGHDAMILAPHLPAAIIFLRSPGGISHHPAETVIEEDVALALSLGMRLLQNFSVCPFPN